MNPDKQNVTGLSSNTKEETLIQKVETKNGFSLLYKEQFLYSRFDAKKNPQRLISSLEIKDESLFFIFSPLLGYGLAELFEKIPNSCFVLAIETDPLLYTYSLENIDKNILKKNNFLYLHIEENNFGIQKLIQKLDSIVNLEKQFSFRRLIPLELAHSFIDPEFKKSSIYFIDNYINQFWRNRMTIIKMGRLYAKNIFQNIAQIPKSKKLDFSRIQKPFLVLGAGISLEDNFEMIKNLQEDFFIIAVDTALAYLLKKQIRIDLCVSVEPQLINQKSFIAAKKAAIPILADLCTYPANTKILDGELSFFLSEYASLNYLGAIKNLTEIPIYQPLGSVGLVAIQTALNLRKNLEPIFFTGFDFSHPLGKTHAKESPSHIEKIISSNRLDPLGNIHTIGKKINNTLYTNPALENYAHLFDETFGLIKNFYNLSNITLLKKVQTISYTKMQNLVQEYKNKTKNLSTRSFENYLTPFDSKKNRVTNFLQKENESLEELKNILEAQKKQASKIYEEKFFELLKTKEYLYIHFPEAYKKLSLTKSIIERLKIEIVFFQKDIKKALKNSDSIIS